MAAFQPDAMFVDHHALAGAIAARRAGIAWATSAPSAQLLSDVLNQMGRVKTWVQDHYTELLAESGLEPVEAPECSPSLVLLYTTAALVGEDRGFPTHYRFVGPVIGGRVDEPDFPWEALKPGRKVLVSFGSLVALRAERFYQVVQDALGDTDLQVVASAPKGLMPDPPANFIVRRWVPQLKLLREVDAVVTHGGSTVNEALACAVPMVVAPMTNDQFIFAGYVASSGAGIRVRSRRVTAPGLRQAVTTVIEDPSYAAAARRIQASYAAAGGTRAAADALEALAGAGKQG
jgi:MGT family glycosyltransferase